MLTMTLLLRRLFPALLLFPLAAQGTIVTTTTDEDDGSLGGGTGVSLREAVNYSPPGDTITFAPALSGGIIRCTLGRIIIVNSINIDGSSLPSHITISGDKTGNGKTADDTYVLQIETGTTVALDSLTISGGAGTDGGGIRISGVSVIQNTANVSITRCLITGNSASNNGGGGIYCKGNLTVRSSTFAGNSGRAGGGVLVQFGYCTFEDSVFTANSATQQGGGGLCSRSGVVTLVNSTVSGNSAAEGGGIDTATSLNLQTSSVVGNSATAGGGIFVRNGTMDSTDSDISANTASANGGGIYNSSGQVEMVTSALFSNYAGNLGGGIFQLLGPMILKNTTLSRNLAKASGGGVYINFDSFDLQNSTISGNTANTSGGGGITKNNGALMLQNTVVAGNYAPNLPSAPNISGTFTGTNNLTSGTPLLAPLGDYGGPTQTMPPLPGSPAIDTGGTSSLTTDQRGFPRVGIPDIGAVEYQGNSDLTRFWALDFDGDASPYGTEQAVGTDPSASDPASLRNLTAPVLNASGHPVLSFGIGTAVAGTRWILRRTTDLLTFTEIYRYSGSTDTAAPGVTFLRTATSVTVTDTNPPPGGGFYRFEAALEP